MLWGQGSTDQLESQSERTGIGPGTSAAASHREILPPLLRAEDQGVVLLKELASFLTFGARKILNRLLLFFFFLQIWLF